VTLKNFFSVHFGS